METAFEGGAAEHVVGLWREEGGLEEKNDTGVGQEKAGGTMF